MSAAEKLQEIEVAFNSFKTETSKTTNKSAQQRARVKCGELTKLLREFRMLSLKESGK